MYKLFKDFSIRSMHEVWYNEQLAAPEIILPGQPEQPSQIPPDSQVIIMKSLLYGPPSSGKSCIMNAFVG